MRKRHDLIVRKELLINSHELVGNYNTLLGRAKRQGRASGLLYKRLFCNEQRDTIHIIQFA